jgi:16S rRNA (guanine(966)-N(2))-methyltransferase RsmD
MRVIGGEFRSRVLKSLPGLDVRPTPDPLREALFNVLALQITRTTFADLYAGTGAVGIEALSRGASKAIFVEQSHAAVRVIRENLHALGIGTRADVLHGRVTAMLSKVEADIVFLDPPYRLEREYESALTLLGEKPPALVIAQHAPRLKLQENYGTLHRTRVLTHGDNALSFYGQSKDGARPSD